MKKPTGDIADVSDSLAQEIVLHRLKESNVATRDVIVAALDIFQTRAQLGSDLLEQGIVLKDQEMCVKNPSLRPRPETFQSCLLTSAISARVAKIARSNRSSSSSIPLS